MKALPHECFSGLSCTADSHWHEFRLISVPHQSTQDCLTEGSRTQLFGRAIEQSLVRFPHCATYKHTFISLFSASYTKDITYNFLLERKDVRRCCATNWSAQVHHSDVSGQSGYNARIARSHRLRAQRRSRWKWKRVYVYGGRRWWNLNGN